MLHLIPPTLHRIGLRLAHALRKVWWRWRKPLVVGCRVLVTDREGRILLVRHSYGSGRWMLPGGGLRRGEDVVAAAARELVEETGCRLEAGRLATIAREPLAGTTSEVHVVAGTTSDSPVADEREIAEVKFFALDALPANLSPGLAEAIPGWLKTTEADATRA